MFDEIRRDAGFDGRDARTTIPKNDLLIGNVIMAAF
jgi:hypothetical protein